MSRIQKMEVHAKEQHFGDRRAGGTRIAVHDREGDPKARSKVTVHEDPDAVSDTGDHVSSPRQVTGVVPTDEDGFGTAAEGAVARDRDAAIEGVGSRMRLHPSPGASRMRVAGQVEEADVTAPIGSDSPNPLGLQELGAGTHKVGNMKVVVQPRPGAGPWKKPVPAPATKVVVAEPSKPAFQVVEEPEAEKVEPKVEETEPAK